MSRGAGHSEEVESAASVSERGNVIEEEVVVEVNGYEMAPGGLHANHVVNYELGRLPERLRSNFFRTRRDSRPRPRARPPAPFVRQSRVRPRRRVVSRIPAHARAAAGAEAETMAALHNVIAMLHNVLESLNQFHHITQALNGFFVGLSDVTERLRAMNPMLLELVNGLLEKNRSE